MRSLLLALRSQPTRSGLNFCLHVLCCISFVDISSFFLFSLVCCMWTCVRCSSVLHRSLRPCSVLKTAIEQLLQATSHVKRSQPGASTSEGKTTATMTGGSAQGGATLASSSTSTLSASALADASHEPPTSEQAPVLLSFDDDAAEDVVAASKDATAAETSNGESESTSTEPAAPLSLAEWSVHGESQIFVISSEVPSPVPTLARRPSAPKKTQSASPSTPSPSSTTTLSFHRRKSPRKVSIASVFGHDLQQITSSVRFATSRRSNTSANGEQPELNSEDEDADAFRFWTGGSREEVNREPWKIQSWLLHGLKQKVEHTDSN